MPRAHRSNSAGLTQYDPTGAEADALSETLGIPVLRHSTLPYALL